MNISDEAHDQLIMMKGAIYELAPMNMALSILVIAHNTIIFLDYYKDRAKFVSSLFMGIALADILTAQGLLVISIISVLVFKGGLSEEVLYKSLYYYMATALPGFSCSRFFNIVLSLTLTVNIVDPFRRINTDRLKKVVLVMTSVLTLLHLSDTFFSLVADLKYHIQNYFKFLYIQLIVWFELPGGMTTAVLYCLPYHVEVEDSRCFHYHAHNAGNVAIGVAFLLNFVLPPLIILVCMIVQIVYLRRALPERESGLPNTARTVSITILMVSLLFFCSHITYLTMVIYFAVVVGDRPWDKFLDHNTIPTLIRWGTILGVSEFTLPLINAALYPLILIWRKPDLRQRYARYYTRCIPCRNQDVPGNQ